jgi:hypothetical protein
MFQDKKSWKNNYVVQGLPGSCITHKVPYFMNVHHSVHKIRELYLILSRLRSSQLISVTSTKEYPLIYFSTLSCLKKA